MASHPIGTFFTIVIVGFFSLYVMGELWEHQHRVLARPGNDGHDYLEDHYALPRLSDDEEEEENEESEQEEKEEKEEAEEGEEEEEAEEPGAAVQGRIPAQDNEEDPAEAFGDALAPGTDDDHKEEEEQAEEKKELEKEAAASDDGVMLDEPAEEDFVDVLDEYHAAEGEDGVPGNDAWNGLARIMNDYFGVTWASNDLLEE